MIFALKPFGLPSGFFIYLLGDDLIFRQKRQWDVENAAR